MSDGSLNQTMIVQIRDRLVEKGQILFAGPPEFTKFTGNEDADRLLNNL